MRIDDRRIIVRHHQFRHEARGYRGRYCEHHLVFRTQGDRAIIEAQLRDARAGKAEGAEPCPETDLGAAAAQGCQRRVDEALREAFQRHQRLAGGGAAPQGLRQDAPEQPGRRIARAGIQRRHRDRFPQAPEQCARRIEHFGHPRLRRRSAQLQRFEILPGPSARDAPRFREDPPRQTAPARPHRPALAGGEVDKRDRRFIGPLEGLDRADPLDIRDRRLVSGKQQMVAIVDPAAEFGIEKRAAAPAGVLPRFIEAHGPAPLGEHDCDSEAGHAGPDHMHSARRLGFPAHSNPCRSTSHSLCGFDRRTRALGSDHPARSIACSIAR